MIGHTMTQGTDGQGLQRKAEARLAALKDEKLVTRIAVLSTSLGQGKTTERLMIGMSVETHKTSPDFDQNKCSQAKSRIMQALGVRNGSSRPEASSSSQPMGLREAI